ncbi:hypothetical protein PHYBOEH_006388 [Phytophthora boehmeriae]|uniref:Cyclin-like domain-containing protein n=1 Tax=Phytophthora boehmeriae TaxID=109152 RepID=A0A8T1X3U0_9STRA|nr:hypothetical protein PHYBOEH_006388 [Phytophthora boehmeriae]
MCINRKRPRTPTTSQQLQAADSIQKRVKTESPTSIDSLGDAAQEQDGQDAEHATSSHRDEMAAALLTITAALGLSRETLHLCVGLLDRYLEMQNVEVHRLEALSISCLWIAAKFVETPNTIYDKSIKEILQRRRHSSNWTWNEILEFELKILQLLDFRIMSSTVLGLLQKKLHTVQENEGDEDDALQSEQYQLALYFADLLLLRARANEFSKEVLADAIWFVVSGNVIADVKPPLLAPVLLLFLAHRDNINPSHQHFKPWFALRCRYGPFLQSPWKVPYDPSCACRVCEHVQDELVS